MAVPTTVITRDISDADGSLIEYHWSLTTANPTGASIQFPEWADRTVTVIGTNWGGATFVLEGGPEDTTFLTLKDASDPATATITATVGNLQAVVFDLPRYMRARLSVVGTAAVIEVYMLLRRAHRLRA